MKIYNNGLIIKDISNQINWDKAASSYRFAFRYGKIIIASWRYDYIHENSDIVGNGFPISKCSSNCSAISDLNINYGAYIVNNGTIYYSGKQSTNAASLYTIIYDR